jgi:recombination protein RecR
MYPLPIEKLINLFSKFPTVGPRTAARFVFYLMKLPIEESNTLIESIVELKTKIKFCSFCFKPSENDLCDICSDPSRDKSLLCIVEKETDLETIEKTKKYKGLYFILGGTVSKLREEDIEKLRVRELREMIKNFKEVIIAINPTTEGEATALYLERLLKPLNIKITRLGRGLPIGGELEYADEETLSSALDNRK